MPYVEIMCILPNAPAGCICWQRWASRFEHWYLYYFGGTGLEKRQISDTLILLSPIIGSENISEFELPS